MTQLTCADKARITQYASPEAIEHHLAVARRRAVDANRDVMWWEALRAHQIEAGMWPRPPSEGTP